METPIRTRRRAQPDQPTPRVRHRTRKPAVPPPTEGSSDYEVGYKKPPKDTRFKAGQSGNPKGRPKGSKNLKTLVGKELNDTVDIREGGHRLVVRKRDVIAKQLVKKGMEGHDRSIETILKLDDELEQNIKAERALAEEAERAESLSPTESDILAEFEVGVRAKIERETPHRKTADTNKPEKSEDAT